MTRWSDFSAVGQVFVGFASLHAEPVAGLEAARLQNH